MGSREGIAENKLLALEDYSASALFDEREVAALQYADCVTYPDREIPDELFDRLRRHFDEDSLVELTMIIAWENSSSKFNHALGVPSQHLWKPHKTRDSR